MCFQVRFKLDASQNRRGLTMAGFMAASVSLQTSRSWLFGLSRRVQQLSDIARFCARVSALTRSQTGLGINLPRNQIENRRALPVHDGPDIFACQGVAANVVDKVHVHVVEQ